ncbi:Transcription factor bHLH113 [Apostasia shenzhenica]|uniref:Transcription factor bHLH113 n=1 Tax=Apostasia shenzhenica TaxID=1088818 RepID=A0A2I0APG7_9ASPA|nr:Transcription factor bHLH113 [Apostasia shenzhenica]
MLPRERNSSWPSIFHLTHKEKIINTAGAPLLLARVPPPPPPPLRSMEEEEDEALVELLLSSPSSCATSYSSSMFCHAQRSGDSSSLSTLSSPPPSSNSTSSKGEQINGDRSSRSGSKKPKKESSVPKGSIRVRKERLGERIVALQQLVSPFGKSDTASVLHEALGYIRFLHDQVQVLSSPYLQRLPSSVSLQEEEEEEEEEGEGGGERRVGDLQRRGLCLMPVASTIHVAGTNGADLWAAPP